MNKFKVTGNFKVTGTPWSHTARITDVPLYIKGISEISGACKPPDIQALINLQLQEYPQEIPHESERKTRDGGFEGHCVLDSLCRMLINLCYVPRSSNFI